MWQKISEKAQNIQRFGVWRPNDDLKNSLQSWHPKTKKADLLYNFIFGRPTLSI
jgi:hypothetical protein